MRSCCCSRSHFADKDLSRRSNHDHAVAVAIAMKEEKADRLIFQSHALTEQLFHTRSETVWMCVYAWLSVFVWAHFSSALLL